MNSGQYVARSPLPARRVHRRRCTALMDTVMKTTHS